MSTIRHLTTAGDTAVKFTPDAYAEAEALFERCRKAGYTGFRVGQPNEVIRKFDPTAEEIIMVPRIVGG